MEQISIICRDYTEEIPEDLRAGRENEEIEEKAVDAESMG